MNFYLQYHNVENEGLRLSDPPFSQDRLAIKTSIPQVMKAEGRVFLIAGIGRPRRYFLWETFDIAKTVRRSSGTFLASGSGWQLAPPVELKGERFHRFQSACANFVGFRCITELPYAKTLNKLEEENRPPGQSDQITRCLKTLDSLLSKQNSERASIRTALSHYQPVRALSVRQPYAEAIMRGTKNVEYRNAPTKIRGRVYIYAALARYSAGEESQLMDEHQINDVRCDDLPRGVIVGTAELFDCHEGDWYLRYPQRVKRLLQPLN